MFYIYQDKEVRELKYEELALIIDVDGRNVLDRFIYKFYGFLCWSEIHKLKTF